MNISTKTSNNTIILNDASKTVAVFCSIMAGMFALTAYIIQRGYLFQLEINNSQFYGSEHFFPPILSALVISIFLLNFPQAYRIAESKFKLPFRNTWLTSDAALSLIGLIILILAGNIFSFYVLHVFYLISFSLFAYVFYSWFQGVNYKHSYIFIGISVLFSIWIASFIWEYGLRSPLFFERLIFFENIHTYSAFKDTLFHSSIINMLQIHGVISTGLDGIHSFFYHFGSHLIFVGITKLLSASAVVFYSISFPIIFVPFMFSSLLLLAINLKKWKEKNNLLVDWNLRQDWKFWLVFFVANIGFIYYPFAHENALYWRVYVSASYCLSLTFSFFLLEILLSFAIYHNNLLTKKIELVFLLLVLPFILILIGLIKLTFVLLILALLFYLFIRLRLYKTTVYNLSFIIISGIGIVTIIVTIIVGLSVASKATGYEAQSVSIFNPFHFLRTWIKPSLWLFFLFFCCFWSILFITLRLWYEKSINNIPHLKTLFINRQLIDVEVILVLCIVGLLPGMLFHLPPYNHAASITSSSYFYNYQNWIALSLLLASMGMFQNIFKKLKKFYFILLIPVLFGAYFFVLNYIYPINAFYSEELHLSQLIKNNPDYLSTPEAKILQLLHKIDRDMPLLEKKKMLVFIPQSNTDFWQAKFNKCDAIPFLVPAITGMAMLDGLPPTYCKPQYYGYRSYENFGVRTKPQTNTKNRALCSNALDKGFSQILRIDSIYTKPRLISCKRI